MAAAAAPRRALALFLLGQELYDCGDGCGAEAALCACARACGGAIDGIVGEDEIEGEGEGEGEGEEGGAPVIPREYVLSAALDALGNVHMDRASSAGFPLAASADAAAHALAAESAYEAAVRAWPRQAQAALSLALLRRDAGRREEAIRTWAGVLALQGEDADADAIADAELAEEWGSAAAAVPFARAERCVAAAAAGKIDIADADAAALGYTRRLSKALWCEADGCGPDRRRVCAAADADASAPAVFHDAVPRAAAAQLRAAFAPDAPYWHETGYARASSERAYFTFGVGDLPALVAGERAPADAVEALIRRLAPLAQAYLDARRAPARCAGASGAGGQQLCECEWWIHARPSGGRSPGHQLHFDAEERTMELSGGRSVVHPAVSSVVYLSGGDGSVDAPGDPTVVLDQTLGGAPARRAWVVHPRARSFMVFDGDRLHGVLPGGRRGGGGEPYESGPDVLNSGLPAAQRLTLLIAWYAEGQPLLREASGSKRARALTARGSIPRPTRSRTWPRALQLEADDAASAQAEEAEPAEWRPPAISPAWEDVRPAGGPSRVAGAAADGARVPADDLEEAYKTHFFLVREDDVERRLWEEHGEDGTYTRASDKRRRA